MYNPLLEKRLAYFKHMKDQLDARDTKIRSINLRKEWLQRQTANNYQLEYDRIRNTMSHSIVPNATVDATKQRMKRLEDLGAQAVDGIHQNFIQYNYIRCLEVNIK